MRRVLHLFALTSVVTWDAFAADPSMSFTLTTGGRAEIDRSITGPDDEEITVRIDSITATQPDKAQEFDVQLLCFEDITGTHTWRDAKQVNYFGPQVDSRTTVTLEKFASPCKIGILYKKPSEATAADTITVSFTVSGRNISFR